MNYGELPGFLDFDNEGSMVDLILLVWLTFLVENDQMDASYPMEMG